MEKSFYHNWKRYNSDTENRNVDHRIEHEGSGGRKGGFRGYTYKENIWPVRWQVDVIKEEGLIRGEIDFTVVRKSVFGTVLHTPKNLSSPKTLNSP